MTAEHARHAPISIRDLRHVLSGQAIAPEDAGYDQARTIFYGGFDQRPTAIVRPTDASDVAQVVSFARDTGLELAVRSGGHSLAGHSTTDGGIGYLVRKHGLTIDDLLAAELVTADGRLLRVDNQSHPDLFWAIRGGGGNFGVATRFQFRLHPLDTIVGGLLLLPATPEVLAGFLAAADAAPEELSTIANIMPAPPLPFVPTEQHGKLVIMATLAYAGAVEAGQRAVAPLRALATPVADLVRPMPYPQIYPPEQEGFHPTAVSRTMLVDAVDRDGSEAIVEHLEASTAPLSVAQLRVLGGAMARVPAEATAFAHRASRLMVNVAAVYQHPGEAEVHQAWVDGLAAALRDGEGRAYVNFIGDEGQARIRQAYPGPTWERLAAIKARYDPTNLFHRNQNIPPTKG